MEKSLPEKDKRLAEIVCRALLGIVAAIRERYDLPDYRGITVVIGEADTVVGVTGYTEPEISV